MTNGNTVVVLGVPIPSTAPIFLAIVGVHVLFGLAAVITGAVAMLSKKGRGRHDDHVDLLGRRPASQTETDRTHVDLGRHAHGPQHGGAFNLPGVAGRSGRGSHAIERCEDIGSDATDKGHVERVGEAVFRVVAVEHHAVAEMFLQRDPETVAQVRNAAQADMLPREVTGRTQRRRKQRAFRSGPPAALMPRTMDQWLQLDATPDIKCAHALRRIELVASDSEQVDAEIVDLCRYFSHGLRGVSVKQNAMLAGDRGAFLDRLDRADLVVRVHDADEDRVRTDRTAKVIRIDAARSVDRQPCHFGPDPFEKPERSDDRRMLDDRGYEMPAFPIAREERTF